MISRKCNDKSERLRKEGNKLYSQREFFNALCKYNESLCFASPKSELLGLAYANRSAVYFEMKLYDKCVRSIELAKHHQYPEHNISILNERENKCKSQMKDQKNKLFDVWNFFKLSYPSNEKLPFFANCLEVKTNQKYGRHVITNQTLKVGDVINIEKPFCR